MKDGGPAFPRAGMRGREGSQDGMTLRDYFAGQALMGLLTNDPRHLEGNLAGAAAGAAYEVADAMLAEREKSE